jgi:hypothetical protein
MPQAMTATSSCTVLGEPLPWPVYTTSPGCGGALSVATFAVDLDDPRPRAVATDGYDGEADEELPAPRLPYQISPADPLLLRVEAEATACDCEWYLEVEWSSGAGQGTLRIDDAGHPFRLSGAEGNTRFEHPEDAWVQAPE